MLGDPKTQSEMWEDDDEDAFNGNTNESEESSGEESKEAESQGDQAQEP